MILNYQKPHFFAFISAIYVTIFATICLLISTYLNPNFNGNVKTILFFVFSIFVFSFVLIQVRLEKYILKSVQNLYDEIESLDKNLIESHIKSTDIKQLTAEAKQFANAKKLEIQNLKTREDYRREYIGNISHELKTPLFTVQGYIATLLDGAMNDKTIRKKYLERAEKGVERLIYIVQDLDLISKLESSDLAIEKKFSML